MKHISSVRKVSIEVRRLTGELDFRINGDFPADIFGLVLDGGVELLNIRNVETSLRNHF